MEVEIITVISIYLALLAILLFIYLFTCFCCVILLFICLFFIIFKHLPSDHNETILIFQTEQVLDPLQVDPVVRAVEIELGIHRVQTDQNAQVREVIVQLLLAHPLLAHLVDLLEHQLHHFVEVELLLVDHGRQELGPVDLVVVAELQVVHDPFPLFNG